METTDKSSCRIENKPRNFNELIRSGYLWKPVLGVIIGGVAGFLLYRFNGCAETPCPATKELYSMIMMGSFWGLMIVKRPCASCS